MPNSVALHWFVHELRGLVMKLESAANDEPEFVDDEFGVSVRDHARELSESDIQFGELSDDEIRRLEPSERVRKAKRILRQMLESNEALSVTLDDYTPALRKCLNSLPPVDAPATIPSCGTKPMDASNSWEADAARLKAENVEQQDQMREGARTQERKDRFGRAVDRVINFCTRPDVQCAEGRRELAARLLELAKICREIDITDRVNQLTPQTAVARCAVIIFEAAVAGDADIVQRLLQEAGEGFTGDSLIDMTKLLGDIGWTLWHGRTLEPVPANPVTLQDDSTTGNSSEDVWRDIALELEQVREGLKELEAKGVPAAPKGEGTPVGVEHDCYVTLDTMANYLRVAKKTMERRYADGKLCEPDIEGGGGKAHQWKYARIRPFLETEFARQLPERWPGDEFAFRG